MGVINSRVVYENENNNLTGEINSTSLDGVVKDIVEKLSENKNNLINDVESGKLPFSALEQEIIKHIDREQAILLGYSREKLINAIKSYLFYYYQYQSFLDDPLVTNVHAVGKNHTIISRIDENGFEVVESTDEIKFDSNESYDTFCDYVANRNNTEINIKKQIQVVTDKIRCKDSILRIDITGREINSSGVPTMVFAKTPKQKRSINELMKMKMLNEEVLRYTDMAVKAGFKILIGGEGGAGKTNFMNAILELIPMERRTLVIQAAEELHSKKKNIIFQKSQEELGETNISYGLKELTLNSTKMRINQLILGELQGDEAYHFFNAGSSGHIAWASTHFERASEALSRMLQLVQYADVNLSEEQILRMLASAVDCIYFFKDFKILEIMEVAGFNEETKKVEFNPVFKFNFDKNTWERVNDSCSKIQEKIDYYNYRNLLKEKSLRKGA